MPRSDDPYARLREAIDELAAADAADLLAEARIEARARVRARLTDALAQSMLDRLHDELDELDELHESRARPRPAPARPPAPKKAPARKKALAPEKAPAPKTPPTRTRAPAAVPDPARIDAPADPAWYVYGVVSAETKLSGELPLTVGGQPVMLLADGRLAAAASQVSLEEFDESSLREHLGDIKWVEATARAHEAVLDRLREQATVIPMRMCTIYRTEGGVHEMLRREAEPFLDALDHLSGKAEWGIKAFIELGRDDAGEPDESGAAYMQRKRGERELRERAFELAEEAATRIHETLGAVASDGLLVPLQRREVTGHRGEMVFNGVYLVADEEAAAFHDEVRELRAELEPQGFELMPTGPWPAYNFVPGTIGAAW